MIKKYKRKPVEVEAIQWTGDNFLVVKEFTDNYAYYRRDKDVNRGIREWVSNKIDNILKEYKADIIEAAADELAKRLARTKAAKELVK